LVQKNATNTKKTIFELRGNSRGNRIRKIADIFGGGYECSESEFASKLEKKLKDHCEALEKVWSPPKN
jgi:hypothetical protein